ncbi:MAG: phosphatidylglycerophosphatase A [Phycisphaerales bacterium JB047]
MITMSRPSEMLLTTGGLGYMRPASGTWGSLPPIIIAYPLLVLGIGPGHDLAWVYYLVLSLIFIIYSSACVLLGHEAEAKWGKDPSEVVADETAGQCLTLMMIPAGMCNCPLTTMGAVLGAFFLFRGFDILKPWPAGAMQKIAGGWGILLDDIFAGIMAGIALIIILNVIN